MSNILEYNGYIGSVEFSAADNCFFGKIEHINDLIMFDGTSVDELRAAFIDAVDSYLSICKQSGKEPNLPFKGTFNIRPGPELHRKAAIEARKQGLTLNDFVTKAISASLETKTATTHMPTRWMDSKELIANMRFELQPKWPEQIGNFYIKEIASHESH